MQEFDAGALMRDEEIILNLKSLYRQHGYRPFRMNRFEEYDFYADKRRFLKSESILTFTDLNGKLMALKPDVTLSIIKGAPSENAAEKVYYSETVYRTDQCAGERRFREIMQVGLEWIGQVDLYAQSEVMDLAARSLQMFSDRFALDISHMGFVTAILDEMALSQTDKDALLSMLGTKNLSGMRKIAGDAAAPLYALSRLYGPIEEILPSLREIAPNAQAHAALDELAALDEVLCAFEFSQNVHVDFSIVNDMRYYNGIIFRGYLSGVPRSVLSGGRYDSLVKRMGGSQSAVGFAVYLDALESRMAQPPAYDADVLILYGRETPARDIAEAVRRLSVPGRSVRAQTSPGNVRAKTTIRLKDGRLETVG